MSKRLTNKATRSGLWDIRYFRSKFPFSAKKKMLEFELDLAGQSISHIYKLSVNHLDFYPDCKFTAIIIKTIEDDYPDMIDSWKSECDIRYIAKSLRLIVNNG